MAKAKILEAVAEGTSAVCYAVVEGDGRHDGQAVNVEYRAATPLLRGDGTPKSRNELRVDLLAALRDEIARQKKGGRDTLPQLGLTKGDEIDLDQVEPRRH